MKLKKNELRSGVIVSYIYLVIYNVSQLIYTPILLNKLGNNIYGVYSLCISIVNYFTLLDFGLGNAVIRYSSIYKDTKEKNNIFGFFFSIYSLLGIIAAIIGIAVCVNINSFFSSNFSVDEIKMAQTIILILTVNISITLPLSVFSSIVTAYQKFIFLKVANIIKTIVSTAVMIIILLFGYKAIAISLVTLVFNLVYLLIITFYAIKKLNVKMGFRFKNIKIAKEIFSFSIFAFMLVIIDKINLNVDMIILGKMSTPDQLTSYSIASRIFQIYTALGGVITSVLLPKFTKLAEEHNEDELNKEFLEKSKWQFTITIYICMSFMIFGYDFIKIWLSGDYFSSYLIALILMICSAIPLALNVANVILQAKNKQKFRALILFGVLILNIVISIPLCHRYGALGCTAGTALTYILGHILIMGIYFYKNEKLDMKAFVKNIFSTTLVHISVICPIILIKSAFNTNYIVDFILLIVYLLIVTIMEYKNLLSDKEKDIINSFIKKIRRDKNEISTGK